MANPSAGEDTKERRRFPRVAYGAWVEELSEEGTLRFYLSRNLSLGGVLLEAVDPPPPAVGSHVRLRLVIENENRTPTLEGTVVRHAAEAQGKTLFGVEFIALDPEREAYLRELVDAK